MRRVLAVGCGVLVLALGCGGGAGDDAPLKEQIDLMNQVAADYEKVTDELIRLIGARGEKGVDAAVPDLSDETETSSTAVN